MRKLLTFVVVLVGGVALVAGPAAADRPTTEVESIVGDQVVCGDVVLTVVTGTIVTRIHEHEKRNGWVQEVFSGRFPNVTLEDEEGNTYRGVGSSGGQFTFNPANEEEAFGHFFINVNIVGDGGLLGKARERFQITRNGRVVEKTSGNCVLPEGE